MWIELRPLSAGFAQIEAMRRRLLALREAGKKVFVSADQLGNREYLLASAADQIVVPPSGSFAVSGIGMTMFYLADTLAGLGIKAHAVHAGAYKSAPEMYTRSAPSPEAIEASGRLSDVIADTLIETVAAARKLEPDAVRALFDRGLLEVEEAQAAGLIDKIGYPDEMKGIIEAELGSGSFVDDDYLRPLVHRTAWAGKPTLAVIPIREAITMGKSSNGFLGLEGSTGAEDVVAAFKAAVDNDDVRAIVLRVDSPGGDPLASDLIWRAVERARKKKPVIASFGDVAASGGYYVACGADTIFAEPTTITGSIGVFSLFFTGGELVEQLQVGVYEDQRGALANATTPFRDPTEAELAMLERSVQSTYLQFKRRVAAGRGLDLDAVEAIAQGRVWAGRDALEHKLIDQLGGLPEALAEARRRVGVEDPTEVEIIVYTSGDDPLTRWTTATEGMRNRLMAPPPALQALQPLLQSTGTGLLPLLVGANGRAMALLPYGLRYR